MLCAAFSVCCLHAVAVPFLLSVTKELLTFPAAACSCAQVVFKDLQGNAMRK
jgi:hypothetical protein